jgi:hypothetical protein
MKFPEDEPDRKTRVRLDLLIALMVVQIVLSIGLWVDRYRSHDSEPEVATTDRQSSIDELYTEEANARASRTEPQATEVVLPDPIPEPIATPRIKVQVLNGCGKTGIAKKASDFLARNDYEVSDVGNADNQNYRFSKVLNRSGNATATREIARLLGIDESRIERKTGARGNIDVTLIIGNDYRRLPFGR